jgi:transcriptional regulator with XRE-family HTH domain
MASVNNIERLRKERGWSRPHLAGLMKTSYQQVEKLEKGERRLAQDWIDRAAAAFGVSPAAIISDTDGRTPVRTPDLPVAHSVDGGELVEIARLDLSLPMGPGATVDDFVESETIVFDAGYVRSFTRTPPHRLRLAGGAGDSMFPTLVPNDLVWIDTTQNDLLHADRIYAASINGGAAIKRLRPIAGGRRVLVISDNKAVESYEVDRSEVVIWGRVIRFARDL